MKFVLLALFLLSAPMLALGQLVSPGVVIGAGVTTGEGDGAPPPPPPTTDYVSVATGDSRVVTEPDFPTTICQQVAATKYVVKTTTINVDPFNPTCSPINTLPCTGGTSYEPSNTDAAHGFTSDESLDNTTNAAVQTALNNCPAGQAVELVAGPLGQLGFVLKPWTLPDGVSLLGDAGIVVFASRNISDYNGTNCSNYNGGSCNPWVTAPGNNTDGTGVYGYMTFDGRGWDKPITGSNGFYVTRIQGYCNQRGGASHGSPACTPTTFNGLSYGPTMFNMQGANDFTMYKVTLKDTGDFAVNYRQSNNGTFWGIKILSPNEVSNTDGIDPLSSTNITIANSYISNGDNHIAIKSTQSISKNISFINSQTGSGIGVAIGSDTSHGVQNVLVSGIQQQGTSNSDQSTGLLITSDPLQGGLVDRATFENVCMVKESNSVRFNSNYGGKSGNSIPIYHDILVRNVAVLADGSGNSGKFTFQGISGFPMQLQLDNFTIAGTNQGITQQGGLTADQYVNVFLGPGQVDSSICCGSTSQFYPPTHTAITLNDSAGTSTPYCTTSSWQPLVGELNLYTTAVHNNKSWSGAVPSGGFVLQAIIRPTKAINNKEATALTAQVQFLDNGTVLGLASLTGDNTVASWSLPSVTSGTHVYTAVYNSGSNDPNYPIFPFGSVTVTIP